MSQERQALVDHVRTLLQGKGAHQGFGATVKGWPVSAAGDRPAGAPHTAWQLLEHLRIAQWDILEFSRRADHVSPRFPDGYWPDSEAPATAEAWDASVAGFVADNQAMQELIADPATDLFARIPWGDGQTVLREALVMADHNAYHVGQLVLLRKQLGFDAR